MRFSVWKLLRVMTAICAMLGLIHKVAANQELLLLGLRGAAVPMEAAALWIDIQGAALVVMAVATAKLLRA